MHELSIAQSILDIASEYLKDQQVKHIHEMEIEIGVLSGTIRDALEFALDNTVKGTVLEHTKINYNEVLGKVKCLNCLNIFGTKELLSICPECGGMHHEILDGKQLRIKSLKIT